jgi:hypothetical protein
MAPDTPDTQELEDKRIELGDLDPEGLEGDPTGMNKTQLDIAIGNARRNRPTGPGGRNS